MTPLQFEQLYAASWAELEELLESISKRRRRRENALRLEHVAELYRRACGHLALARARAYPAYLVERLERVTSDAHQAIYYRGELGAGRLKRLLGRDFPAAVRAHAGYVWVAAAVLTLPGVILGMLVHWRPELVLSLVDAGTVAQFEAMYGDDAKSIGHLRDADTDWSMFGYYIQHNIGITFQCFAGGLLLGVGSLFYMAYNGAVIGGIAGYVTERGFGPTFYSFVATHSAFELTAIVLSGAAGMRLGHAIWFPGRHTRVQSLVIAARESIVIIYGAALLLLLAAGVEAFWSSAGAVPHWLKYTVATVCWTAVIAYLSLQGRSAS
jgi:uncharacterized membrane protein SpoIIM required for sporulation